jgi:hypothetical protein
MDAFLEILARLALQLFDVLLMMLLLLIVNVFRRGRKICPYAGRSGGIVRRRRGKSAIGI